MRTRDWLVILGVVALPLLACSSTDSANATDGGTAGKGGSGGGTVKPDSGTAGSGGGTAGSGGGTAGSGGGGGLTCPSGQSCAKTDSDYGACVTAAGEIPAGAKNCDANTPCEDGFTCYSLKSGGSPVCLQDCEGGSSSPCGDCLGKNCSSESSACGSNADCKTLLSCIGDCTDQACADACAKASPNGVSDYNALLGCAEKSCKTECFE